MRPRASCRVTSRPKEPIIEVATLPTCLATSCWAFSRSRASRSACFWAAASARAAWRSASRAAFSSAFCCS